MVMKLSVSILEADIMHLCHLQLCFSIDQIQLIYVHEKNINDILCHGDPITNKMVSDANTVLQ